MVDRVRLDIVTPHQIASVQHAPVGFIYVDQMFREAGWTDEASRLADEAEAALVRQIIARFRRPPYRGRVLVRLVSLWSLWGFWLAVRFRLRTFPAVVVNGKAAYAGHEIEAVEQAVRNLLGIPPDTSSGGERA